MNNDALIQKALRYQENAHAVIGEMLRDSQDLNDYLVNPRIATDIIYGQNKTGPGLRVGLKIANTGNEEDDYSDFKMTKNALSQFATKNKVPGAYLSDLSTGEPWERNLAAIIMNNHSHNHNGKKVLIRTVRDEARAYLSTTYDRYRSVEVFQDFIKIAQENNAVISNAYYNDISAYVEALVIDPVIISGEEWLYGIQFRNSDFGGAALDMRLMLVKLICTNGMTRNSLLRKIHRGSEIESMNIKLSEDTIYHNTMTKKNLIKDFAAHIFNKDNILAEAKMFEAVGRIQIESEEVIKKLPPMGATKEDIEEIQKLLMNNAPHTGVVNGGNVLRVSNAVSYLANTVDEADRIANYKDISGKLITHYSQLITN